MPKIRGDTTHVHPILVSLTGILGGIVSARAVFKVLFDFFRVHLETNA